LLATRADTSEVLHARLRKGAANTQRGALRFVDELLARVRRAGATGEVLLRADSGFWNNKVIARLAEQGCRYSIGVRMAPHVRARIALIPDEDWQPIVDYPDSGVCELAETMLGDRRLIVRRVHLHAQDQQTELFAYWRHFAFVTNRTEPMALVDAEHRQHAQVELVIRDLKDQALAHFPSGQFSANSAWTVIACLAHNLGRWTAQIGLPDPTPRAPTIRRRLFALPGRLTTSARRQTLHLPARWPWQTDSSKHSPASGRHCRLPQTARAQAPKRPDTPINRPAGQPTTASTGPIAAGPAANAPPEVKTVDRG